MAGNGIQWGMNYSMELVPNTTETFKDVLNNMELYIHILNGCTVTINQQTINLRFDRVLYIHIFQYYTPVNISTSVNKIRCYKSH